VGPEVLFTGQGDRIRYLDLLQQAVLREHVKMLAYVLMDTHVHLALRTPRGNISSVLQWLHGRYGMVFNKRVQRRGHLFGGRFYSTLVEDDGYLLEVTRYIHLNPVRAGLVHRPEDFLWSSYRWYLGGGDGLPVDSQLALRLLAADRAEQVKEYRKYVEEPLAERLRRYPPGTPAWEAAALAAVADALGVLSTDLHSRRFPGLRAVAARLLVEEVGIHPATAAHVLRVRVDSLARGIRRTRKAGLAAELLARTVSATKILGAARATSHPAPVGQSAS
jgi:REP element-mobilizing transposase RayT